MDSSLIASQPIPEESSKNSCARCIVMLSHVNYLVFIEQVCAVAPPTTNMIWDGVQSMNVVSFTSIIAHLVPEINNSCNGY